MKPRRFEAQLLIAAAIFGTASPPFAQATPGAILEAAKALCYRIRNRVAGLVPQDSLGQLARLSSDRLPVGASMPSGLATLKNETGREYKFIPTCELTSELLGYPEGAQPAPHARSSNPAYESMTLESMRNTSYQLSLTSSLLVSQGHNGSGGTVFLAKLTGKNGVERWVAAKTYYPPNSDYPKNDPYSLKYLKREAIANQLLHDQGLINFHGTYEIDGHWYIVTDVAPGDSVSMGSQSSDWKFGQVSRDTFSDLESVLDRLGKAQLYSLPDFQYFITPKGRIQIIDPGGVFRSRGEHPDQIEGAKDSSQAEKLAAANGLHGDYTVQRAKLLLYACLQSPGECLEYVENYRHLDRAKREALADQVTQMSNNLTRNKINNPNIRTFPFADQVAGALRANPLP